MELLSPAKINLFLEVTGKRSDGYHDLRSLMCCISLFDKVTLTPGGEEIRVSCDREGIPEDETNLAARAAKLFFEKLGRKKTGVKISIEKNIPAGAGLGGGSSNAAAVLTGLNRFYDTPFSGDELVRMGVAIGADVPFFIYCKAALAEGVGEKLEFCENIVHYHVILIYPGVSVSTAQVYKKLNFGLTKSKKETKSRLLNKRLVDPVSVLFNDLESPAFEICSEISGLHGVLASFGADGVLMSGSGSSVFGLYADLNKAGAAYAELQKYVETRAVCKDWQLFLVDMIV